MVLGTPARNNRRSFPENSAHSLVERAENPTSRLRPVVRPFVCFFEKDVIAGIRHIYGSSHRPKNIWENTDFMEEFGGDHWVRPGHHVVDRTTRYNHG